MPASTTAASREGQTNFLILLDPQRAELEAEDQAAQA